jgi:NitT/TauT family transport system ATP-binding protein
MQNNKFNIKNVSHSFPEDHKKSLVALRDINLEIKSGEFISIVGPSGCGKSTLLRIIAGLIKPTSGEVENHSKVLSFVFQNFALFPWLTVRENIEFGLIMKNLPKKEITRITKEKMSEVGLTEAENKYPKELSGGMKQRVGIARALAVNPDVLLLDEPFSSLDSFTADSLRKDLFEIWQKYKMTVVMVTHIIEDAVLLSSDIAVISKQPGEIIDRIHLESKYPRDIRSVESFKLIDEIREKITNTSNTF